MTQTTTPHWPCVIHQEHLATEIELPPSLGCPGRYATVGSFLAAADQVHPFVRAADLSMSDRDLDAIAKALGFVTYDEGYNAYLDSRERAYCRDCTGIGDYPCRVHD